MKQKGYTLIEALMTLAILSIVVFTVSAAFTNALRGMANAKKRLVATSLGNEMLERMRNMAYDNLGVVGNIPSGPIPASQTITRSDIVYTIATSIDYVDDPFDGLVVGTNPLDTVPTDYKRGEITITWPGSTVGVQLTARYSPNGLEVATNTGALLITVSDSHGQPVPLATVHVTNPDVVPPVDITNTTDINGNLQLLSLPPSTLKYHIEVTKAGYSTDGTYPATAQNPNPYPQDLTIEVQKGAPIAFYIDQVSTLNAMTFNQDCTALPNFSFNLFGQKTIGIPPPSPVLKYNTAHQTGADGKIAITDVEWDDYDIQMNTAGYDIAGYSPPNALNVLPNTTINWTLILAPQTTNSVIINVIDANTKLPVTDAQVVLSGGANGGTKLTGRGFIQQTSWSGGSGQEAMSDQTKYQSDNGAVDGTGTPGTVSLASSIANEVQNDTFTSDSNKDSVTTTANWNIGAGMVTLQTQGVQYELSGIAQSIQLNSDEKMFTKVTLNATDNANGQTITYYASSDGATFEEVTPGVEHVFGSQGSDLRFKIELATTDPAITPEVYDVSLTAEAIQYTESGELISSTYDLGTPSSFSTINWNPSSQIAQVGADSVRFQIATNNDNTTWNFIGPDGTAGTFYTASTTQVSSGNNDSRYLRYKLFLHTDHRAYTPRLSDVSIGFTSQCTPPGQVFFSDLDLATYTADVTHASYNAFNGGIDIDGASTSTIELTPL